MLAQVIANFPFPLQIASLAFAGAVLGAMVNWAIYDWTTFLARPISPWMKPHPKESPRRWLDRIPILGWWGRKRDEMLYGRFFWLRPMLLEVAWTLFVPLFYFWLSHGGMTDFAPVALESLEVETWMILYTVLIALMCVATFIDFDEKMIPDAITVPGTLFALVVAAFAPWSRLPEISPTGGWGTSAIDYLSPNLNNAPLAFGDTGSLTIALALFAFWVWALMPKLPVWYVGWGTSIRMMYAYAFRPKRKSKCDVRIQDRATPTITKTLCLILVMGLIGISLGWSLLSPAGWASLFGALLGLTFGAVLIWSIRIIGTFAMGQEAMGFGDVTLMAMIGATFGWQATLMAFAYAMIVVVVMLAFQIMLTGNQELAFGPYLCAGAVVLIFRWGADWPVAREGIFALGPILLYILLASMFLLGIMLLGLRWIKGATGAT